MSNSTSIGKMEKSPKKKLLDLVWEAIGRKQYSKRTKESHIHWIKGIKV